MKIKACAFLVVSVVCTDDICREKAFINTKAAAAVKEYEKFYVLRGGEEFLTAQQARTIVANDLKNRMAESWQQGFFRPKDLEDFIVDPLLCLLNKERIIFIGGDQTREDVQSVVKASPKELKAMVQKPFRPLSQQELDKAMTNQTAEKRRHEVKRLVAWIRLLPEWQEYEKKMRKVCGC